MRHGHGPHHQRILRRHRCAQSRFPTLVFGPGGIAQVHTTNEFVEIDDMVAAAKMYLWTALDLLAELTARSCIPSATVVSEHSL